MSDIAKRTMAGIGALLLPVVAAGVAYYRSFAFLPFALGGLLGAALNVLKVVLLDRTVEKVIHMDQKAAGNYIRLQHLLRFLLTGLALLLGALLPFISIWGVAAGILTLPIATSFAKHSLNRGKTTKDTAEP